MRNFFFWQKGKHWTEWVFDAKNNGRVLIRYKLRTDDLGIGKNMSIAPKHGWKWAYQKLRGLHCSRGTAFYRATLYSLRGDTGTFYVDRSWHKVRLRR